MFTTTDEVLSLTGKTVTDSTIIMAQSLVEAYIGRTEIDVTAPRDKLMLSKAVAYQAAYMKENPDITFDQMALTSLQSPDQSVFFNRDMFSPFISPWAAMCCSKLTWRGTRSIKTGKSLGSTALSYSWTHDTGVM